MFINKWTMLLATIIALPVFAQSTLESNRVSTANLIADYYVLPAEDTPNMEEVVVNLSRVLINDGKAEIVELSQSVDDVVTISVGSSSIVYDPTDIWQK